MVGEPEPVKISSPAISRRYRLDRFKNLRCIPASAARYDQPAAAAHDPAHAFQNRRMIFNPVERGIRENDVKRMFECDASRVQTYELQIGKPIGIIMGAGELDHLRGTIETHAPSTRHGGGNFGRDLAVARADIEH